MWESGRGHACMPGSVRHSVSARTNSLLSVAVSSEARIALCTTVEFAGLVEVRVEKMEMPIGMVLAQTR
jgi:hypothetical protein